MFAERVEKDLGFILFLLLIVVSVFFDVIVVAFVLFATVVVLQVVADVFGFVDVVFVIVDFGKFRTSSGSYFHTHTHTWNLEVRYPLDTED